MRLQQPTQRTTPSDDNLIPMINVVFLLLVFFMVAGTIRPSDPLSVAAPTARSGTEQTAHSVLYVKSDSTMMLDDVPVNTAQLTDRLVELLAASTLETAGADLQPPLMSSADTPSGPSLAIKADAQTPVAVLRHVFDSARVAGFYKAELITLQTTAPR